MEKVNDLEQLVVDGALVYTELVEELIEEFAPVHPWWSQKLKMEEKLWRWTEQRDPIIAWLVEAGIFMGMQTYQEVLERLEDFWIGNLLVDMVPPEIIDKLPIPLIELVQAGPYDAADHIRSMEREYARRESARQLIGGPPLLSAALAGGQPNEAGEGAGGEVATEAGA